jgi:hypothetical protein
VQLSACTTREEFDQTYNRLSTAATTAAERMALADHRDEHRGRLPSQHNVKPEDLVKVGLKGAMKITAPRLPDAELLLCCDCDKRRVCKLIDYKPVCAECRSDRETKEAKAKLHSALKWRAAAFQREGYAVQVSTPGSQKLKIVSGACAGLKNVPVVMSKDERDEMEDAWTVRFATEEGRAICSLHATKSEATPKEEEGSPKPPHLAKLEACTTRQEYTPLWNQLLSEFGGGSKEYLEVLSHYDSHWFALPEAPKEEKKKGKSALEKCPHCPVMRRPGSDMENHQIVHIKKKPAAPAPKRNKGKNEEPIRGTIKNKKARVK